MFKIPKFEFPQINPNLTLDLRDPDKATNDILAFLQTQSQIANRQFKTSRNLILATIFIMILQIAYAVWTNIEANSIQNSITKIIDTQSQQSEVISRMTLNLLGLENQVRTLEQESARLKQELNK